MNQSGQPTRPVYGPYNVLLLRNGYKQLVSLPYSACRGSQLYIACTDNVAQVSPQNLDGEFDFLQLFDVVEIEIRGKVGGYQAALKRQQIRNVTGPMTYGVPSDLPYEEIAIWARNMSGGRYGSPDVDPVIVPPVNPHFNTTMPTGQLPPEVTSGFYINVTLHLQES